MWRYRSHWVSPSSCLSLPPLTSTLTLLAARGRELPTPGGETFRRGPSIANGRRTPYGHRRPPEDEPLPGASVVSGRARGRRRRYLGTGPAAAHRVRGPGARIPLAQSDLGDRAARADFRQPHELDARVLLHVAGAVDVPRERQPVGERRCVLWTEAPSCSKILSRAWRGNRRRLVLILYSFSSPSRRWRWVSR